MVLLDDLGIWLFNKGDFRVISNFLKNNLGVIFPKYPRDHVITSTYVQLEDQPRTQDVHFFLKYYTLVAIDLR